MLGANDGIVSTASLIVGVAAAAATQNDVLIAGVAGLVAGAMSMAAGEYVCRQRCTNRATAGCELTSILPNVVRLARSTTFSAAYDAAFRYGCLKSDAA